MVVHMHSEAASDHVETLDASMVLGEAVLNAGARLGLSTTQVGQIIGRDRSSIGRKGVRPQSKSGELAMFLIRIYRSLFALVGGNESHMRHFMQSENRGTGGIPLEQIQRVSGLVSVMQYLDAMRGRG